MPHGASSHSQCRTPAEAGIGGDPVGEERDDEVGASDTTTIRRISFPTRRVMLATSAERLSQTQPCAPSRPVALSEKEGSEELEMELAMEGALAARASRKAGLASKSLNPGVALPDSATTATCLNPGVALRYPTTTAACFNPAARLGFHSRITACATGRRRFEPCRDARASPWPPTLRCLLREEIG